MKQSQFTKLLAVTISFELMVSPMSFAVDTTQPPQAKPSGTSTAETINEIIKTTGAVLNTANQIRGATAMSPQMMMEDAKLQQQMAPSMDDPYFNPRMVSSIPGLANYLALNGINPQMLVCSTLRTTLTEVDSEVCRRDIPMMTDTGMAPQFQLDMMLRYKTAYKSIEKTYENYTADSNSEGQAFGVGCMNNAMKILNGFFKYRMDELDKLVANLEAMNNQFREASRSDLDAIEESVALLEGEGAGDIAAKVKTKNPDLFDFEKRFNSPACNSMFQNSKLNQLGRDKGLNGIDQTVKQIVTTKEPADSRFSGESYAQMNGAVIEDINRVADKIAKQFELNFQGASRDANSYNAFLKGVPESVSSTYGITSAIKLDTFSDTQMKFNESMVKFDTQRKTIEAELSAQGIQGSTALNLLGAANSSNFNSEVATIENRLKNNCLDGAISSMGKDRLLSKIYDPSSSKFANKNTSGFIKDKISQILDNDKTSLETKLGLLKSLESQTGSRYYMRMESSYEVQNVDAQGNIVTKVVDPSSIRSPSVFFSDIINNCNAQFKANKLNNKLTGASAIQSLRQLNSDYQTLKANQLSQMKQELKKKLIECTSPEISNNTVPGSCQPGLFDPRKPGFCANAAFSCSKNMQACNEKSANFVKEIKDQKSARVTNYKALLQKNKQDIVRMFDTAMAQYMKEGEMMRGLFGAGFSAPAGIMREVPEKERYLDDFRAATSNSVDGQLLLEDPDKYVAMFKSNIDKLKKSVEAQQNQILGGDVNSQQGLLKAHIEKVKKNYETVAKAAKTMADACEQKHGRTLAQMEQQRSQQMQDYNKKMKELGEKRMEYCNRYTAAQSSPYVGCNGFMGDTAITSMQIAELAGSPEAAQRARNGISQFSTACRAYNNTNNTTSGDPDKTNLASQLCGYIRSKRTIYKNSDSQAAMEQICGDWRTCQNTPTVTSTSNGGTSSTTPNGTTTQGCNNSNFVRDILSQHKIAVSGEGETDVLAGQYGKDDATQNGGISMTEDMGAICAANDNTGRSTNPWEQFRQLTQQIGQQAGSVK